MSYPNNTATGDRIQDRTRGDGCNWCHSTGHATDLHFEDAFTRPTTGEPYPIPDDLRRASERICRTYSIGGQCDPMYVANVIAHELGIGNGESSFTPVLDRWGPAPDTTVEGFANYATMQIGLMVANDATLLASFLVLVADARDRVFPEEWPNDLDDPVLMVGVVARVVKEWVEASQPEGLPLWWDGIVNAGLGDVEWYDLARWGVGELAESEERGEIR